MLGARPVPDSVTPSCEGRPPAFQASRATRATNSAVASAACLEGLRGSPLPHLRVQRAPGIPRSPLGVAPRLLWAENSCTTRALSAPRECGIVSVCYPRHCEERKRRSNPLLLPCCLMDCFASLAMTISTRLARWLFENRIEKNSSRFRSSSAAPVDGFRPATARWFAT
jgi:hypothetical protein